MSNIVIAWELGAGFGHMVPMRPLIQRLSQKHRVTFVLRDLSRSQVIFKGDKLSFLQAPVKTSPISNPIMWPATYPQILHNVGYETVEELAGFASGWRTIYEELRPDLAIFDHSPTAMLATRGMNMRRLVIGSGFLCPPPDKPMWNLRPWMPQPADKLQNDEDRILGTMNTVLERWRAPKLEYVGQLFKDVDDTILTTFPELDHYYERQGGRFWGIRPTMVAGVKPEWPAGNGSRIFAYMKAFQHQNALYQAIASLQANTLIASDRVPEEIQKQFASSRTVFSSRYYDLPAIGKSCQMAILNANHDTMINLMLMGIPLALIPLTLEQWVLARAAERIGVGLLIDPERPADFAPKLADVLNNPAYRENAQRFARHYSKFDSRSRQLRMEDYVESMLSESFSGQVPDGVLIPKDTRLPECVPIRPAAPLTLAPMPGPSAAVAEDNSEFDAAELQRAIQLHQHGQLDAAVTIYQTLLARQPLNVDALHLLGVAHLQRGDAARAVELIGRAIALNPQHASFHSNIAEAYRALNQFDKAIEHGLAALRFQPNYPEASNNLGLALLAQGKYKAAAARFTEAMRLNPRYAMPHVNLGHLQAQQGDLAAARTLLQKAIELDPENSGLARDILRKIDQGQFPPALKAV